MKLMGRHLLHRLARSGTGEHAGAVRALCAELESASWAGLPAAIAQFPAATINGHRIEIPISNGVCVQLAINCAAGVVLVESAG